MKKLFLLAALLTAFASCRYKDLCYDHDHPTEPNMDLELSLKIDLDVDLDVSVEAHTKIETPTYMKVCFFDPLTGSLSEADYVGPNGGPLHVNPGTYNMVVYSFDTEWTRIRGENHIDSLEAFTSDITAIKAPLLEHSGKPESVLSEPVIYTPDHLLVVKKEVEIPPFSEERTVIIIEAQAATIVETYGFEVTNVTGIEYIASVEAFVTNQARSCYFGRGEKSTRPATISFPVEVNKEEGKVATTFNTFGKLPGASECLLHILLTDTEGNVYTITVDITDQFDNPDRIIVIDEPIDIPNPEGGGGIAPTVEKWEEVITDVPIG